MSETAATHMLIFRESTPERYDAMTVAERREALDRWNAWCDALAEGGSLQAGNTLAPEGRIVAGAGSRRVVDGPFAEAREVVGGYFLLAASGIEEATAIAEQCPLLPYGMVLEVRPVAGACHLARSLGWTTMRGPGEVPYAGSRTEPR